jgi:hypothetical protein
MPDARPASLDTLLEQCIVALELWLDEAATTLAQLPPSLAAATAAADPTSLGQELRGLLHLRCCQVQRAADRQDAAREHFASAIGLGMHAGRVRGDASLTELLSMPEFADLLPPSNHAK